MQAAPIASEVRRSRSGERAPLLWASLSFAGGIIFGAHVSRPALLWALAACVFIVTGRYLLRARVLCARFLGLAAIFVAGALLVQLRTPPDPGNAILPYADGQEISITAHVIKEGYWREVGSRDARQLLDMETEQVSDQRGILNIHSGLRVSFYQKEDGNSTEVAPRRLFRYGERLQFTAKLSPPHNYGNPGAFDYRGYLTENGIAALASTRPETVTVLPGFAGNRWELWRTRIHRSIIDRDHALWPGPQAALVDAMVIGDDAFLGNEIRTNFQRTGTYHVLVVSGMNVGILALVVFWVLRRLRVSDFAASVLAVLLCVAYAILTDVGPPIWRATLMLSLYLGARLFYRDRSMLNAIGAAAIGVLALNPQALFGASFQLTFLCVLLIAAVGVPVLERTTQPYVRGLRHIESTDYDRLLAPKIAQFRLDLRMIAGRVARLLGNRNPLAIFSMAGRAFFGLLELLTISAIMQVGLALPMAYYFHRATGMGLPANIIVVPLLEVLMPAALWALAASYVSFVLAKIPALITSVVLHCMMGTVQGLGNLRMADIRVPTPGWGVIAFACITLAISMVLARCRRLLAVVGLLALSASAFWMWFIAPRPHIRPGVLEMTAIDVGQGDSLFVVSPQGRTVLIDAGGMPLWMHSEFDMGEQVVSPYLWSRGISRLDAVSVSHPHADHIGGMSAILANFHPRELWLGVGPSNMELEKLLKVAKMLGIRVIYYKSGDNLEFGGTTIRILAPFVEQEDGRRSNEDSMAMKISYGKTSILLEGDVEKPAERRIALEQPQADLLKVAHHGSVTSTIPELLAAVHPRFAVISVGARNSYGHPRAEVLQRLREARVQTYRTDMNGAVTFYLDGRQVIPQATYLH